MPKLLRSRKAQQKGAAGGGGKSGEANLWSWGSGEETTGNLCVWLEFRDLTAVTSNEITLLLRVRNQPPHSGCAWPGRAPAQSARRREEVPSPSGSSPWPLSAQLERPPRGAGLKGPGTPPRPRLSGPGLLHALPGPRDSRHPPARPGSKHPPRAPQEPGSQRRAPRARGGVEAGAQSEPPLGRERAVPEPSAPPAEERGRLPPRPRAQPVPAPGPGASN